MRWWVRRLKWADADGAEFSKTAMWGAIERGTSAAISATERPAVRWGGVVAIVAGALIAAFALPKAQPRAQPMAPDEAPVLAADTALAAAMRADDKAAARRLLALQFSRVDADGKIHSRREFLADLKHTPPAPPSDAKIRNFGLLATVTGRRKATHDSDVFSMDVWVRQKGAWRALLMQDVPMTADDGPKAVSAPAASAPGPASDAPPYQCNNPCNAVPYRVRSPAEQDVVSAFQTIMKAIVARNADEWAKHVADDFVVYASGKMPIAKAGRIAAIERQKESDAAVRVGEVQTMRLAVYGDSAVMTTTEADDARPPYRAARIFVKRDGRWLMSISAHTDVK
jgi:hypothetical protein